MELNIQQKSLVGIWEYGENKQRRRFFWRLSSSTLLLQNHESLLECQADEVQQM